MASLKEWWEFFSDSNVKWTFGVMMFLLWVVAIVWMAALNMVNSDDPQTQIERVTE
jgi:ascorbate-specific PTS system EIIC-type component UlaA